MKFFTKFLTALFLLIGTRAAIALPSLEEPVPLPAKFTGIITIYPDNHNTKAIRNYWLAPSVARIVTKQDQSLAFGLVHSGVSSFDPDGINALLNVTVQPYIDKQTLTEAQALIEADAKAQGATAVNFRYIAPTESTARLIVGGQFYDWNGKKSTIVKGGLVEAGIPFQVKLEDESFDVRALTQAGGDNASTFGVLYTMKFNGVRNRCDFDVTASFKETYEHYKTAVSGSGWYGIVKANAKVEWEKLKSTGAVKLNLRQCREEDFEKFDTSKIMNSFLDQITNRTGIFARTIKPSGLPDAPGGGGAWGWSLSAGGGFEGYDINQQLTYAVDVQFTVEEEIAFGMSFPSGGPELIKYVKNLTDTNKPFPTSDDFKAISLQHKKCTKNNVEALKKLRSDKTIDENLYAQLIEKALTKGCFVDYSAATLEARLSKGLGVKTSLQSFVSPGDGKAANIDPHLVIEYLLSR